MSKVTSAVTCSRLIFYSVFGFFKPHGLWTNIFIYHYIYKYQHSCRSPGIKPPCTAHIFPMSLPNGVKRLCPICLFHCLFNHEPSSCYHELMVKMALCNCIQISALLLLMFQPLHINQSYLVEETKCIKGQLDEFATQRHFFSSEVTVGSLLASGNN